MHANQPQLSLRSLCPLLTTPSAPSTRPCRLDAHAGSAGGCERVWAGAEVCR